MRWIHELVMQLYGLVIGLAASAGYTKAIAWKRMRLDSLDHIRTTTAAGRTWCWVHCASVGEFEQARPVMEAYRESRPKASFLLTFFSPSGTDFFVKNQPSWWRVDDAMAAFPLDTRRGVARFLKTLTREGESKPAVEWAAAVKYEVWPEWLRQLRAADVPCVLLAAHVIAGRWPFRIGGAWYRKAWRLFDAIWVQQPISVEVLQGFGIDATVGGDPRFDRVFQAVEEAKKNPDQALNEWVKGRLCVVAGSAWGEEQEALQKAPWSDESCLIIVPHEWSAASIQEQKSRWENLGKNVVIWSEYRAKDTMARLPEGDVMLVDAMGFLTRIYAVADVAVVGGGFGAGIHNTLEPAAYGIPIWTGPNTQRFAEAEAMKERGCLQTASTIEELAGELEVALCDRSALTREGAVALAFAHENRGAGERLAKGLLNLQP
jgi:3-deoxy-D-manno-octulosonic-acid transferase